MARARSPERDKAFELYKQSKGERQLKDIAEALGVSDVQVRKWKNLDKWDDQMNGNVPKSKGNVPNEKNKQERKPRSGNPNPQNQFTSRNTASRIHGLRSKFFHKEQIEIMEALADTSFADQIWLQIEIKFSAIIRMQKIMWVEDENDHLSELSGHHSGEGGSGSTYKVAYAFERFEVYIKAQARAMAEYRNLVKQFLELTHDEDERRMKLEQMQINIDKSKVELAALKGEDEHDPHELVKQYAEMIDTHVDDVFADEVDDDKETT